MAHLYFKAIFTIIHLSLFHVSYFFKKLKYCMEPWYDRSFFGVFGINIFTLVHNSGFMHSRSTGLDYLDVFVLKRYCQVIILKKKLFFPAAEIRKGIFEPRPFFFYRVSPRSSDISKWLCVFIPMVSWIIWMLGSSSFSPKRFDWSGVRHSFLQHLQWIFTAVFLFFWYRKLL